MEYKESDFVMLSKAKIKDKRLAIISENKVNSGFTIAQQLIIPDGEKIIKIFMKGSLHIGDIDGLYNLRDAINESIEKVESKINQKV